jgi:hypothetical protein
MSFMLDTLQRAHRHCACHRKEVEASDVCGCFHCQHTFPPSEITEWHEESAGNFSMRPDRWTAMCPRCGVDAVLGSGSGLPVTDPNFLTAMHNGWFEK